MTTSPPKPGPGVWADAIRDDVELGKAGTLVGHTLRTYLNRSMTAHPSRETLAKGAKVSVRTVDKGLSELEARGFLLVTRGRGGRWNQYQAVLPSTADEKRQEEWARVQPLHHEPATPPTEHAMASARYAAAAPNGAAAAPESGESAESEIQSEQLGPVERTQVTVDHCLNCNAATPSTQWDASNGYCATCAEGQQ